MKKKFIIVLLIFLISGCKANYNITINENSSIKEKVVVEVEDSEDNYDKIKNLFINNNISKTDYKVSRIDDEIQITYSKNYDSVEEYILKSKVYKQVFPEILLNKNNEKTSLSTSANFNNSNISINKDNDLNFESLIINIDSKLPVIFSTADKKTDNIYTWEYNGESREKNIDIAFYNRPLMITYKSLLTIFLILITSIIIGVIIYNRINDSKRI